MSNLVYRDPFDDLLRGFFVRPVGTRQAEAPTMSVDVKERENAYAIHAEIPGVKKEDIHVSIEGNRVSISAETKIEKEEKEGEKLLRSERYVGKVARSFTLAQDVDEARAQAKYSDGVLELTLPKKAAGSVKKLTVQ